MPENLTFRRILSRLSRVKTSFSLHSLLKNFAVTFLFAIFACKSNPTPNPMRLISPINFYRFYGKEKQEERERTYGTCHKL